MTDGAERISTDRLAPVEAPVPPKGGWQLIYNGGPQEALSDHQIDAYSPIDNKIASIPNANVEDVDRAVQSAKVAAKDWAKTTPRERVEALEALSDRLVAASEQRCSTASL